MTASSRRSTAPRDSVEPSGRPTDGMTTTPAESFSHGVLAIAITLLVLRLGTGEGGGTLAHRLSHQSPLFLSYFISFMSIGTVWLNHHEVVSRLSHLDHTFLILNLLLLMVVSLLPFPTRVVGQELAGGTHADQRTAALRTPGHSSLPQSPFSSSGVGRQGVAVDQARCAGAAQPGSDAALRPRDPCLRDSLRLGPLESSRCAGVGRSDHGLLPVVRRDHRYAHDAHGWGEHRTARAGTFGGYGSWVGPNVRWRVEPSATGRLDRPR